MSLRYPFNWILFWLSGNITFPKTVNKKVRYLPLLQWLINYITGLCQSIINTYELIVLYSTHYVVDNQDTNHTINRFITYWSDNMLMILICLLTIFLCVVRNITNQDSYRTTIANINLFTNNWLTLFLYINIFTKYKDFSCIVFNMCYTLYS